MNDVRCGQIQFKCPCCNEVLLVCLSAIGDSMLVSVHPPNGGGGHPIIQTELKPVQFAKDGNAIQRESR